MEEVTLFLASPETAHIGARAEVPEADQLSIGSFFTTPLALLYSLAIGQPVHLRFDRHSAAPFQFLDGPPNPEFEEGFQLYRVADDFARWLRNLSAEQIEQYSQDWLRETQRLGCRPRDQAEARDLLARMARLAVRGYEANRPLFLEVLVR
jgi:hypothetical protein